MHVCNKDCSEKLKIIVVEPLKKPYLTEINTTLKAAQKVVGGDIEVIHSKLDNILIITNRNGELKKLPLNRSFKDNIIFGTFFICGDGDENFRSLNESEINRYTQIFNSVEKFSAKNLGNIYCEKIKGEKS